MNNKIYVFLLHSCIYSVNFPHIYKCGFDSLEDVMEWQDIILNQDMLKCMFVHMYVCNFMYMYVA